MALESMKIFGKDSSLCRLASRTKSALPKPLYFLNYTTPLSDEWPNFIRRYYPPILSADGIPR